MMSDLKSTLESLVYIIGLVVSIGGGGALVCIACEFAVERAVRFYRVASLVNDYAWNRKEYKAWKAAKNEAAELWSKS